MTMLADRVDAAIGVDTHKHTHTAAVVTPTGGLVEHRTAPSDGRGIERLLAFAHERAPGRRVWAIEGTGSYGAGLTSALLERGEWVVEIDRPRRPALRDGAKSDALDALGAAREALARDHLTQPRRRGDREALRVLLGTREAAVRTRTRSIAALHALVVYAPEAIRGRLRELGTDALVRHRARLRPGVGRSTEQLATLTALRSTARRVLACEAEPAVGSSVSKSRLPASLHGGAQCLPRQVVHGSKDIVPSDDGLVIDQDRLADAAETDALEAVEEDAVGVALVNGGTQPLLQGARQVAPLLLTGRRHTDQHFVFRRTPRALGTV